MKKIVFLTVTALTLTCFGGQALTAQAAPKGLSQSQLFSNGKTIVFTYNSGCNPQSVLDKLMGCFPNITLPDCQRPGGNAPENNLPEADTPGNNTLEMDVPDNNTPETEAPDVNLPGLGTPDNNPGNSSTEESTPEETPSEEHAFIQQLVDLVNAERAKAGLSPLTINTKVQAAAMVRAKECEQRFSHTRPNGTSFATALKEQKVSYRSAGENIAWGQHSPEEVMKAWMNSSGHRANIMNPNFTTIGVGYYENARGTDYWCQLFTR